MMPTSKVSLEAGAWLLVAVKRVSHDLERAIFLSAPHNDGFALFYQSSLPHKQKDQGHCAWRLDRHGGAPDFDDEITGFDDINSLELKSGYPGFDHLLDARLDRRSALDHGRSGREKAGPLLVEKSEGGKILVGNCLRELGGELLDLCARVHGFFR